MSKKNKYILIVTLLLFIALVALKHMAPQAPSWAMSFSGQKKSPYGCSVIRNLLNPLFPGQEVMVNQAGFSVTLNNGITGKNLIVITDHFSAGKPDISALLAFVSNGNNLFLSAFSFPAELVDTLNCKTSTTPFDTAWFVKQPENLHLAYDSPVYDSGYAFPRRMPEHYFTEADTSTAIMLGNDRSKRTNFMHVRFGSGNIYLHCQPMAFTNYHIVYGNYQYACAALSVLPVKPVIWDQFYKPDRFINTSPVRYILNEPPLRSAYYVALSTLFLYMLFGLRRKQRAIPVIVPPENTSLQFIRSVGQLYYKSQNHADLAKKKVRYFYEFIRSVYQLKPPHLAVEQSGILSMKTGLEENFIRNLLKMSEEITDSSKVTGEQLIKLNTAIEEFYNKRK